MAFNTWFTVWYWVGSMHTEQHKSQDAQRHKAAKTSGCLHLIPSLRRSLRAVPVNATKLVEVAALR